MLPAHKKTAGNNGPTGRACSHGCESETSNPPRIALHFKRDSARHILARPRRYEATRVPTGRTITSELLRRVEGAETALFALGFTDFRVRLYDEAARLQLPEDQLAKAVEQRQAIRQALAPWFDVVLLDTQTR